ncbi:MAG: AprI/Inh family metalloprotease inhibitor [Beijerinckiaceae bacterium]
MNLFVRTTRMTIAAGTAFIAGFGVLAVAPHGAFAQGAPTAVAQQTQRQPQQRAPAPQHSPRVGEIAGRYTVLREEGKDTLCMVTLFDTARGRGVYRAQLAPACRDNGIVIFEPVAWSVDGKGHLILQARKGHKMVLEHGANGVWQRTGDPKARPLGLRRI